MSNDPELSAMQDVSGALSGLSEDAARRVLQWAADRYSVSISGRSERAEASSKEGNAGGQQDEQESVSFTTFGEFFNAADPDTEAEKALVAGYWFQVEEGENELTSRLLNKELKLIGHQSTNITRDINTLMSEKPAPVVQLRKTGSSKQAHKIFKLTPIGITRVNKMLQDDE